MKKVCFVSARGDKNKAPYRLAPNYEPKWGTIEATPNINDADYYVIIENASDRTLEKLPKDKTFCFPSESDFVKKSKIYNKYNFKYTFTYNTHYHFVNVLFFMGGSYDTYKKLEYPEKTNLCSAIMSSKTMTYGHKLRKSFLINFCNKYPGLVDVYGQGWRGNSMPGYKGQLAIGNRNGMPTKYDGLVRYRYSICCENSEVHNGFSEKLTDAFLTWTIPIYFGCKNLSDFFPKDSFYQFHPNEENVYEKVKAIIERPVTEANIKALKIARELCLDKYNIWPSIERLVNFVEENPEKGLKEYKMYRYIDHVEDWE